MARRVVKAGKAYIPTAQELREHRYGIPPTIANEQYKTKESEVYRKVRLMGDAQIKRQEPEYREYLQWTEHNSPAFEICYHKWFALRWEGEKRGFWDFIPVPGKE